MPRQRGAVYQFEHVPPDVWRRAKARAALEGKTIRDVFLRFLRTYAAGIAVPKDDAKPLTPAPTTAMKESRPADVFSNEPRSVPTERSPDIFSPDPDLGF